ncbi:splicing factor-like protein 1 isoform X2 [Panicum virgatum]|uniref:splicing factor-like protein 1 isoform X2 n=1 Tax=Panicum virgatum TaxID=38727 RepID=UPI0019D609DF|nr:splicing factor-like protein 1 isoform X2 [Panicum virgatum]
MATKLDQPSPAEHRRPKSAAPQSLTPKISIFGTKAGFVIPKNKLAGSIVTRGATSKNDTATASKEDNSRHAQRKTKWGPDLAADPAVCKGRALAYQTRVEQITKQLKSETLDMDETEGSMSTGKGSNSAGTANLKDNKGKVALLELERSEIIGEILRLNPGYKVPENYKPVLKEAKIPLPAEAHPGHGIIGVLIGPESNTQKRLHEETGAVIQVYGTKKINGEMSEILYQDINEAQAAYEDLHINVSADSYDKIDAAVALIELLLAPVSVKSTATSTTTTVSSAVTSDDVNPVQNTTSQQGLLHYQSNNAPWLSTPQTYGPPVPSSGPVLSTLPNNSLQPQPLAGSFSIPPYTGQPPHTNSMPKNPFPVPGPQQPISSVPQHPPQSQANSSFGPFGQPPGIVNPQMTPSSSVPPPVRPLQIPHASGGWPSFSPITSQSQWPQASPTFMPVRPISVSPLGATPPQGPAALTPPSNIPTMYRSQQPAVSNFTCSAPLVSRPPAGAQSFSTLAPHGPASVAFPGGTSTQSAYPLSMQVVSTPGQMRGPPPAFSQVGPTPGIVPPLVASPCPPASGPASTSCSRAPIGALRPHPVAGDFTFRPVVSPAPTRDFAASGSQMGIQGRSHPGALFFHPGNQSLNQSFPRPCDGRTVNIMGQTRMHAPPPHLHGAFPRNPSPLELPGGFLGTPPAVQAPQMPAPSNPSSFLPPRPFQPRPSLQLNPFASRSRQGGNPIYDPFAPTAVQKTEASDPEYEDLMASVGVK